MAMPAEKSPVMPSLGSGIRSEFPIFTGPQPVPLAYLDTAATSQKPRGVIDCLNKFWSQQNANISRGAYRLSSEATELYEGARARVASFLGASNSREIIFTKNATESLNLVAYGVEAFLNEGDTVVVSLLEHHSNFVPWQLLAQRRKLNVLYAPVQDDGRLDLAALFEQLRNPSVRVLAITALANAIGTEPPLAEILAETRARGILSVVDACQAAAHRAQQISSLAPDFLAFSGHKVYGPTGIGVLYARLEHQERMSPFLSGGGMISQVSTEGTTWAECPHKFEAGTPPIAEAIGLRSALDFLCALGFERVQAHEQQLFSYAFERLQKLNLVTLYGPKAHGFDQGPVLAFNVQGVHAHDFATIADAHNVQLRAGHHCAMPLMRRLGIGACVRASFGVYSCEQDVDQLVEAVEHARRVFA